MYSYLITFLLLSFSTNTYAADTKADADCKNNFVFLEMDYVSLLKEYDTYRSKAISYGSKCLATFEYSYKYKNKEDYKKVTSADCEELNTKIKSIYTSINDAALTALTACVYKHKTDTTNVRYSDQQIQSHCMQCAENVKRVPVPPYMHLSDRNVSFINKLFHKDF